MSTVRMTGLISGLDTESIIKELVNAQKLKNKKTSDKLTLSEWKEDKWKELNTKLYKLYTDELSKLRLQASYMAKKATTTNDNLVSITGSANSPKGLQTLEIKQMASSQYVTGGVIYDNADKKATASTKLTDLKGSDIAVGTTFTFKGAKGTTTLEVKETTTISEYVTAAAKAGMNANFDATQGRIFISSKESGSKNSFQITATPNTVKADTVKNEILTKINYDELEQVQKDEIDSAMEKLSDINSSSTQVSDAKAVLQGYISDGEDITELVNNFRGASTGNGAMNSLGLDLLKDDGSYSDTTNKVSTVVQAKNSIIVFNGAELVNNTNSFSVNGLTFDLKGASPGETISINVTDDTQATYDMVKKFINSYNEILKEMNSLYYANTASGYDPLTDDEKEAMTDDQVEKWETKIKDSILRRDSTLGSVIDSVKTAMMSSVTINGKNYSLATFGIETSTDYTEKGLLHIHGNKEDATYPDKEDKLMKALTDNPDTAIQALSGIFKNLYDNMTEKMSSIPNVRSIYTFYNDKLMDKEQTDYKKRVTTLEEKLTAMENKYYKQFSAMETALAKLQSQSNSLAGLLGTSNQ